MLRSLHSCSHSFGRNGQSVLCPPFSAFFFSLTFLKVTSISPSYVSYVDGLLAMLLSPCLSSLSAASLSFSSCCQCQISKLLKTSTGFPLVCVPDLCKEATPSLCRLHFHPWLFKTPLSVEDAGGKQIVSVCLHWITIPSCS